MSSNLRRIRVLASLLSTSLVIGCGLATRTTIAPNLANGTQSQSLPHEAIASSAGNASSALSVLYPPPPPLPEQPSESRPNGDDVVWAPGYWIWDTNQDNWRWVAGVWVHMPPGRQWTPGYWSAVADGWRWVPGVWTSVAPPPPCAPPLAAAYNPGVGWLNDPGFGMFAGYGLWWPMYGGRPFYDGSRGCASPPLQPSGPIAAHAVPSSLVPALASNVHETSANAPVSSQPAHLDMAAILASMPKPLASSLDSPSPFTQHGTADFRHDGSGRMTSLFLNPHLETALHDHLNCRGDCCAHPFGGERNCDRGHECCAHGSGGQGGGHGR